MFFPQASIQKKRSGLTLSAMEISDWVQAITHQQVSDAQLAAMAMALAWQGMNPEEMRDLTLAMRDSGQVLHWDGICVDKHSTGGVGDMVSLVLAPMLAACGVLVPMVTGRGLGHTGGTQDKLEAIPGYNSTPELQVFQQVVQQSGCAIVGQTAQLAPADKRWYAVRDHTATVEVLPLICASILSKKLAAGIQHLVLDIKCGNGAIATDDQAAQSLASHLLQTAKACGLSCSAMLTDMNQPLISNAGNALELITAMRYLARQELPTRLHQLVLALGSEALLNAGSVSTLAQAQQRLQQVLDNGAAAECFNRMCYGLGGPLDFVSKYARYLQAAPLEVAVYATPAMFGQYLHHIDTRSLGYAVVKLGAGRIHASDLVDPRVGLTDILEIGSLIEADRPLAIVHASHTHHLAEIVEQVRACFSCTAAPQTAPALLIQTLRN